MKQFLKLVADDLYSRMNGNFEGVTIVFPNKRASLFLNEYLLEKIGNGTMWSPAYITINELFENCSGSVVADSVLLVSRLHKIYNECTGSKDSLDNFYYWGEMLLKDFDDVDKNLANAKQLFANIKDLHDLGTAQETLDAQQKESIKRFFANFNIEKNSDIKKKFTAVWDVLYSIYTEFKENLKKDHLAYEGMLYREVAENREQLVFPAEKYVFVGFNALNGVENRLFDILKGEGKALFYWDYDKHYVRNEFNEAGHFMRKNLERFPNSLGDEHFDNMRKEKNVTFVAADTENIQTRYIPSWLQNNIGEKEIETAIVLCDETMLESVLHTLPQKVNDKTIEHLNITMGYPIAHTPVYSLVKTLIDLRTRGYDSKQESYTLAAVETVLKHPYIIKSSENAIALRNALLASKRFFPNNEELCCDEFLSLVFSHPADNAEWIKNIANIIYAITRNSTKASEVSSSDIYEELFCEALLKVHNQAQRMITLLEKGEIEMQAPALGALFMRMIAGLSMPFHGEPVMGMQIMGLLETRNLDFKNIIVLGANEGNMPKKSSENSFIPYNLRRAFGLTMSEHRDSIYAYYFYRLLQRAENITVAYNASTDSKNKGECSRYLLQILGSNLYDVKRIKLEAEQTNKEKSIQEIAKSANVMEKLYKAFDTATSKTAYPLSPTGINRFIDCGLKFYYYYVLGLKKFEEVDTELKANEFGIIFHDAADTMYKELVTKDKRTIDASDLEQIVKNPVKLYKLINDAFVKAFFKSGNKVIYNGKQLLNRDVIYRFMQRLIQIDKEYAPFRYVGGEKKIRYPYIIKDNNGREIKINIGGTIDRMDVKGDRLDIIDYKTGGGNKDSKTTIEDIFAHNGAESGYRLQAFLYSIAVSKLLNSNEDFTNDEDLAWIEDVKKMGITKIVPSLIYIHKKADAKREDFVLDYNKAPIDDIGTIADEYMKFLDQTLKDIFDTSQPFRPANDKEKCVYCDYKDICGRS